MAPIKNLFPDFGEIGLSTALDNLPGARLFSSIENSFTSPGSMINASADATRNLVRGGLIPDLNIFDGDGTSSRMPELDGGFSFRNFISRSLSPSGGNFFGPLLDGIKLPGIGNLGSFLSDKIGGLFGAGSDQLMGGVPGLDGGFGLSNFISRSLSPSGGNFFGPVLDGIKNHIPGIGKIGSIVGGKLGEWFGGMGLGSVGSMGMDLGLKSIIGTSLGPVGLAATFLGPPIAKLAWGGIKALGKGLGKLFGFGGDTEEEKFTKLVKKMDKDKDGFVSEFEIDMGASKLKGKDLQRFFSGLTNEQHLARMASGGQLGLVVDDLKGYAEMVKKYT